MNRKFGWMVAAALAVPAGVQAQGGVEIVCGRGPTVAAVQAAPGLIARASVGGIEFLLDQCIFQVGKLYVIDASFFTSIATGSVFVTMNPDPFINFNLATTNLIAGPVTYQFTFGTPIVQAAYTNATSSLGGSVTAGNGAGSATNDGTTPFLVANGTFNGVPAPPSEPGNLGVDIGFGPCTTAAPPALPMTVNCPPAPAAGANAFGPTVYNDLDATITYSQSGELSQVAFNGRVDLFTAVVPEPATVSLLATGALALGLGGFVRRRRS
jgi:hypothetical protein